MITKSIDAISRRKAAQLCLEQLADPEYSMMLPLWELCDDVFRGELAVKAKDDKYIYRPKSKQGATRGRAWEAYKGRGKLPDFAAKTLNKMCGILSSSPADIRLDGKASILGCMREYATPYHDGLDSMAGRVREHILRSGRYCLLLEPDQDEAIGFHINEYKCRKFLRAKAVSSGGETYAKLVLLDTSSIVYDTALWRDVYYPQITLLALDEKGRYYQARFGESGTVIDRYTNTGTPVYANEKDHARTMGKVFASLESFNVDKPEESKCTELIYPTKYGRTLNRIPFVCINPADMNFTDYRNPPLLNLCLQSIHILNADCDHQTAIFLTTDPIAVFKGVTKKDNMTLSSDIPVFIDKDADFLFVSPSGVGLDMQKQNIEQMKEEAREMGVSLAGQEGVGNTPVGTMQLYRNSQTADLMRINQNVGKAIENILRFAGKWLGMSEEETARDIHFTPSSAFAEIKATAQECAMVAASAAELQMTDEEVRKYIEKNGLGEPRPWEEVKRELEMEQAEKAEGGLNSVAKVFGFKGRGAGEDR